MMEDGNPNGFYVFNFTGTDLTPEFIPFPFGPDANQRLRITLDPLLKSPAEGSVNRGKLQPDTRLVVNLYDGGVRDKVWAAFDGAPPIAMTYTVRTDPHVERTHRQYADTDDSYGRPHLSSHIWELALPNSLAAGLHHVIVTTEDEFGQRQRGNFTFEILDNQ
jgi:hypothetical protein